MVRLKEAFGTRNPFAHKTEKPMSIVVGISKSLLVETSPAELPEIPQAGYRSRLSYFWIESQTLMWTVCSKIWNNGHAALSVMFGMAYH